MYSTVDFNGKKKSYIKMFYSIEESFRSYLKKQVILQTEGFSTARLLLRLTVTQMKCMAQANHDPDAR